MTTQKSTVIALALSLFIMAPSWASSQPTVSIEALVESQAYSLALLETKHLPPDAASYWEGYCLRRLGQDPMPALSRVPRPSRFYFRACDERAQALSDQGKYVQAAEALEEAVSAAPEIKRLKKYADLLSLAGRYDLAADYYRKLSEQFPDTLYPLAWCYTKLDNYPKAMLTWLEALKKLPQHPQVREAHLGLANSYIRLGRPFKAAEYFRLVGERDRAEFLDGEGYAQEGRYDSAIAHYRAAKQPWAGPAAYGIAYCQWKQGRLLDARQSFAAYLKQYPQGSLYPDAIYAYARILEATGELPDAKAAYEKLAETIYREKALYELCGLAFSQELTRDAIHWAKLLEEEFPKSQLLPAATWALAESALSLGDYALAIDAYDRLAQHPDRLNFLKNRGEELNYRLGVAYFRAEKYQQAMETLAKCQSEDAQFWRAEAAYLLGGDPVALYGEYLRRYPSGSHVGEALYGQGWCHYRNSRFNDAQVALRDAADKLLDPKLKRDALERLSEVATKLGRWNDAEKAFQDLEALADGDAVLEVRFLRAQCLHRLGRTEEALALFASYAEGKSSRRYEALAMMGQIQMKSGHFQEAITHFEKLAKAPDASTEDRLDASYKMAACHFNMGNPQAACEIYAHLLDEPDLASSQKNEIQQLLAQGRIQTGELALARALAQEASSSWSVDILDEVTRAYVKRGDSVESLQTLALLPLNPERLFLSASNHQALGDATRSEEILKGLSNERQPYQEKSLIALGEMYRQQLRIKDAAWAFNRLHALFPSTQSVKVGMDTAKMAVEHKDEAIAKDIYRTIAQTQSKTSNARNAWMSLGELEYKAARYREAVDAFRKADAESASQTLLAAQSRYWVGASLVGAARYEEAIKELELLKRNPKARLWLPLAWLKQGEACEFLRRFKQAKDYYQLVLSQGAPKDRAEAATRIEWINKNIKGLQ